MKIEVKGGERTCVDYIFSVKEEERHTSSAVTYLHLLKRCSNRQRVPGNKMIHSTVHAFVNWQSVLQTCHVNQLTQTYTMKSWPNPNLMVHQLCAFWN
jgi:hypothetical protein